MSVAGRKKLWRIRTGKLWAGLALLSYSLTSSGYPLPATNIKDQSIPFPCENHACGCQSAEQCWRHCCCFTVEDRWAWAKARGVEPPTYAEKPLADGVDLDHASSVRCCHAHHSHEADKSGSSDSWLPRWVSGFSAQQCRGLTSVFSNSGAQIPPSPTSTWSPCLLQSGWICAAGSFPLTVPTSPLEPPPRRSNPSLPRSFIPPAA
jgi:hypothetical protein